MAHEEVLTKISVEAGSDLSSSQYRLMTIDASEQLVATGAGAKADGVLQDTPDVQGLSGALAIAGVSKGEAGAAFTAGDLLSSDASGRFVTATTGDEIVGKALKTASGIGAVVAVLLKIDAGLFA